MGRALGLVLGTFGMGMLPEDGSHAPKLQLLEVTVNATIIASEVCVRILGIINEFAWGIVTLDTPSSG
jgi:hypothetical protein